MRARTADRTPKKSRSARILRRAAILSAIGIVIASVMTFGLVEFFTNMLLGRNVNYDPIDMVGMIGPMGLLMGFVAYASWKATNRYLVRLLEAIDHVAEGNFDTRLDEANSGAYREVFANFNRMCAELQGIQTLRDDFINHFSHEFKTPITSINGFARILLEEKVTEEERVSYLRIIAEESERLADLSTGALLMTKLDSQQYMVDRAPYRLDEQIRHCAILLSPQWTKKGIELTAELAEATFTGDADLMQHVWINLIGNAVKFTPTGGSITIGLRQSGDFLTVEVADSGSGMTEDELAHAFEKYYQGAHGSRGLGLGLAIARRVVELSGGSIGVRSSPGAGSVFTVRLPSGVDTAAGAGNRPA